MPLPSCVSGICLSAEAGPSPSGRAAMLYDWEVHEAQLLDEGMPEDELELPGTANIAPVVS